MVTRNTGIPVSRSVLARVPPEASYSATCSATDGIVLGSPVYINSVTAQLKLVIDRLADAIHCQMFEGKYG
ncbi:MAG: NAD(P)H-dependent oxidoreductase, partial [Ilumatobacteraceae bacterium]